MIGMKGTSWTLALLLLHALLIVSFEPIQFFSTLCHNYIWRWSYFSLYYSYSPSWLTHLVQVQEREREKPKREICMSHNAPFLAYFPKTSPKIHVFLQLDSLSSYVNLWRAISIFKQRLIEVLSWELLQLWDIRKENMESLTLRKQMRGVFKGPSSSYVTWKSPFCRMNDEVKGLVRPYIFCIPKGSQ